jgi:nitrate reductase NapD
MSNGPDRARRDFLLKPFEPGPARQPAADGETHISSAVVTVRPERAQEVARAIAALPGVEVHAVQHSKIVVVLEGPDSGTLGARLVTISLMDGVFSANMVFEQVDFSDSQGV